MPATAQELVRAVLNSWPGATQEQLISQVYTALAPNSPKKGKPSAVRHEDIPLLHMVNNFPCQR